MRLSVVIPAFNEEALIGACLESVVGQLKLRPYDAEVIVVNNASTDRTRERALAFPEVKVVDEPRKGLSRARQAGFAASTGDLIANIDADTRIPDGWIDRVFTEFERNPRLVALSGPFIYYDLSAVTRFVVRIYYFGALMLHVVNHKLLGKAAVLQGGNFILRRSALDAIGGYDVRFDFYGEDSDVARRIQKQGAVKFTFKLPMQTSGRRLKKDGLGRSGLRYITNYFWTITRKEPFTKTSYDIRPSESSNPQGNSQ